MKPQIKSALFASLITVFSLASYAQGRPETSKDIKDIVKTHKSVALLPFTFAKKEYGELSEKLTLEMIEKSEKEKGLAMQSHLYEMLIKKSKKYPYQWKSIEEVNNNLDTNQSPSAIAKALGVDAVVSSVIETPKIIIPDELGGETMSKGKNIYGVSGSGTYVVMTIHTPDSDEPIWKWRIKLNGTFKNTELMIKTLAKNYLSEKFPYKF